MSAWHQPLSLAASLSLTQPDTLAGDRSSTTEASLMSKVRHVGLETFEYRLQGIQIVCPLPKLHPPASLQRI